MKTLKFYGFGDDTFGEYGATDTDVDNCASCRPIQCIVRSGDASVIVTGQYDRLDTGCWDIGVSLLNENVLPDWNMRISFDGYSTVLEIDVPDDFTLT